MPELPIQQRHVLRGQSTALCPATQPVAHIAPPPRACQNMGSNAGPGCRRALGGCCCNPWVAARPTPATVPGLERGAACWPLRWDAGWVLPLHLLYFRPGPPQLMSAPRDPARLDCEHPLPSLAGAHPSGDRAFELYLFFFGRPRRRGGREVRGVGRAGGGCEFVPRNCGGTKTIHFIPHSYFHTYLV